MTKLAKALGSAYLCILLIGAALPAHAENPRVLVTTDVGEMIIELFPERAPVTVENFLAYVDSHFYNGTIFHRVIPGFVVQGGGLTYDFTPKETRDPIVNESDNGLRNSPMTLSMARTSDPDSATSQFFINLNDNRSLNATEDRPGYTVFGRVVDGQETVIAIVEEPRGNFRAHPDAPNTPVRILKAQRMETAQDDNQ
ncbi:peptidylprolyl isomerase [Marinimicrobium sp. ABcell2]|uniref:peptidylprolyl isomerase n=1 Tax=Marinimicrobium sp. ABcell2 TaxID=3069751 RepID=UPI0027B7C121|nr:peptidylprolyl isomerase [Marinimicrobium sp. ABcell2]MDQ2075551.1 peptidylprolyl isomerase [Marinimicrobium sp. ABcell2]